MIPSRRVALATSAVVLGLLVTSCGDAPLRTSAGLPTISLGAGGGASAEMAGAPTADSKLSMPYWGDVTYEFSGDLPDLGAAATAYRFAAGGTPDAETVAALADAFGVEVDMAQLPDEQGGGWMVGPADYSGPTLTVARDGLLSWWYGNPSAGISYPGCAVAEPAVGVDGGAVAPPDSATAVPPPAVDTTVVGTECVEPEPPAGVPSADEARARATELLAAAGVDTDGLDWDVYADDWSASATGFALIDGARGPLAWSIGFGAGGSVQWASGTLATAEEVGDYPIVSTTEGLARLNDDTRQWQGFGGMLYAARGAVASDMTGTATAPVAGWSTTSGDASTTGTVVGEVTVGADGSVSMGGGAGGGAIAGTIDTVVPDSMPTVIGTAPVATVAPEPVTVELTSVRLGTTQVWDADGTVWQLPAYVFSGTDTGDVTVLAVDEEYLDIPEVPMPEPMPVPLPEPMPPVSDPASLGTVPPDGVVVDPMPAPVDPAAASDLVGLSEQEAAKVAAERGWTIRVARLDGEDLAVTMDYSPTRINVAVDGGLVTEVLNVG